jgi:hypothetical protein
MPNHLILLISKAHIIVAMVVPVKAKLRMVPKFLKNISFIIIEYCRFTLSMLIALSNIIGGSRMIRKTSEKLPLKSS